MKILVGSFSGRSVLMTLSLYCSRANAALTPDDVNEATAAMALAGDSNITNPKPLHRPVSRSMMAFADRMFPNLAHRLTRSLSVVLSVRPIDVATHESLEFAQINVAKEACMLMSR